MILSLVLTVKLLKRLKENKGMKKLNLTRSVKLERKILSFGVIALIAIFGTISVIFRSKSDRGFNQETER